YITSHRVILLNNYTTNLECYKCRYHLEAAAWREGLPGPCLTPTCTPLNSVVARALYLFTCAHFLVVSGTSLRSSLWASAPCRLREEGTGLHCGAGSMPLGRTRGVRGNRMEE